MEGWKCPSLQEDLGMNNNRNRWGLILLCRLRVESTSFPLSKSTYLQALFSLYRKYHPLLPDNKEKVLILGLWRCKVSWWMWCRDNVRVKSFGHQVRVRDKNEEAALGLVRILYLYFKEHTTFSQPIHYNQIKNRSHMCKCTLIYHYTFIK